LTRNFLKLTYVFLVTFTYLPLEEI